MSSGEKFHPQGCCSACSLLQRDAKATKEDQENKETQDAVIAEKAFDSTVSRIKGSLSWSSSGLLSIAVSSTIIISFKSSREWVTVLADWVYVIILIIIQVALSTLVIDAVDAPDAIGKELDTTVPPKKIKRGDKHAEYEFEKKKDRQRKKQIERTNSGIARRLIKFAEKTTDKFLENLTALGTAIFANVVAVAVNSAVNATLIWIFDSDGNDLTVAGRWGFSFVITMITCYVALKTGKAMDDEEIELYDLVYENAKKNNIRKRKKVWTHDNVYQTVVKFAARRRFINLINYTLGLTMAWSWQSSFKETILSAYEEDEDDESTAGLWLYVLAATLIVAFFNSVQEKYILLYPKDEDSALQLDTQERKFIGTTLYKNAQTVVGIAWYDACLQTSDAFFDRWGTVAALWLSFFLLQTLSVLGEFYWRSLWMRFEMIEKGIVNAVYNAFDELWDRDQVLENDDEEVKKVAKKSHNFYVLYVKEIIELTVYAWGIGAGWTAPAAVKAILVEIYDGEFDPDTSEDIKGNVLWSAWVAFFISLIVSTLVMWFLSNIQKRKKDERRAQLKKVAKVAADKDLDDTDDEDKDDENDNNNNNQKQPEQELQTVKSNSVEEEGPN